MPLRTSTVLSHWHQLFEGFSTSTQEFYTAVEEAIRRRELPEVTTSRVMWKEGGIASADREYLRVERRRIAFDICSAPYGGGHFFSWCRSRASRPATDSSRPSASSSGRSSSSASSDAAMLPLVRSSCIGGIFAFVFPFLGLPLLLLFLGYLVHEGTLGDEEWVLSLPILGWLYLITFNPNTYYRLDTAMMFRDSVRSAVEEVVNQVREAKGLRALGVSDFRPHEERGAAS